MTASGPGGLARKLQTLLDKGSVAEAAELCREAVSATPRNAELWRLSGIVSMRSGDLDDALRSFERAVELAPGSASAHSALAAVLLKRKDDRMRARAELEAALAIDPRREQDVDTLVSVMLKDGVVEAARTLLRRSLALGLKCPGACAFMASAELDAGNIEVASKLFVLAANWSEKAFLAIETSSVALMGKCSFDTARLVLEPVAKAFPGNASLMVNLAVCQMQTGRFDEGFETFAALSKLVPDDPAYLVNYGTALYKTGRFDESICCLRKVVERDPANYYASLALSLALLKSGRLKEGWPYWESRLKQPPLSKLARNKLPLWTPDAPAAARVLVRCEQGFGDSIFFARLLPLLRARCSHVAFLCRPELLPLFAGLPGIDELMALDGDEEAERGCSFRLPLASLPQHFIPSIESIPKMDASYLKAPVERLAKWRDFVASNGGSGGKLKVGLCWSGSQANIVGRMRSVPVAELAPLFKIPDVVWFSLQADASEADVSGHELVRTSKLIGDFADTAALIENLDVVVSIDTAVAHLAGAMGKSVLLPLCVESDWRWFTGRDDSPWYPSMSLFRQVKWGDWTSPIARIAERLRSR